MHLIPITWYLQFLNCPYTVHYPLFETVLDLLAVHASYKFKKSMNVNFFRASNNYFSCYNLSNTVILGYKAV